MINDWLENEERLIQKEAKRKKRKSHREGSNTLLIIATLLSVFFCGVADAQGSIKPKPIKYQVVKKKGSGVWFHCRNCGTCQWQDDDQCDYMGRFFCLGCSKQLN